MRHKNIHKKFGREVSHRLAMLQNLTNSLLEHEKITTTVTKSKEVRSLVEKLITLGKRGDLHAHRLVYRKVQDRTLVSKVFKDFASRFKDRAGGYTRIVKTGPRKGDCAPMSIIELLPAESSQS